MDFLKIQQKFLCCYPINLINWQEILSSITWDEQELLLNSTILSDINKKYPVKFSYQLMFLRSIIQTLEENILEIHDLVYEVFCSLQEKSTQEHSSNENYTYKHYMIFKDKNSIISLKESINFVTEGTTGLCSWQAAIALSDYLLQNSETISNKKVLELGSGTGLCGMVASKFCKAKTVFLTDGSLKVISLLKENLKNNFNQVDLNFDDDDLQLYNTEHGKVGVLHLLWEEIKKKKMKKTIVPEVIIASDVIYDERILPALIQTIEVLFNSNDNCVMYLAATVRNENTLIKFLELLENCNFEYKTIEYDPDNNMLHWDTRTPIKIFLISRAEKKV